MEEIWVVWDTEYEPWIIRGVRKSGEEAITHQKEIYDTKYTDVESFIVGHKYPSWRTLKETEHTI